MDTGLKGKNVLITGGASGIGFGISRVLADEGMNIAIASRNPAIEVKEQIEQKGVKCALIRADVTRPEDVSRMFCEAEEQTGKLDCFVNCAAWTWHQPITKITPESWESTLNTNLRGCLLSSQEAAKRMIARQKGSIVIIGSTVRMFPGYNETAYRVSKTGVKVIMENLAIELAPHGIRTNMVTPGHFITRMTAGVTGDTLERLKKIIPCYRTGEPEEIGNAVAFLLSDRLSGYTYGAELVVDGGLTLHPLNPPEKEDIRALNM